MGNKLMSLKNILLGIFILSVFIYWPLADMLPIGNHIWAKSDFLALAHGFIRNEFDFFHPQTYQLNLQFPTETPPELFQGITSADFPILPYLAALISAVVPDISTATIFRFCTLLFSIYASYKIFMVGRQSDLGERKAFMLSLLVYLNPGQFIYQFGFTPSPVAFAASALAIVYLYSAISKKRYKDLYFAALYFTLATLVRTTHIIFLGAMGIVLLQQLVKGDKSVVKPFLSSILGGVIIVSFYIYNVYLRHHYGSIFLGDTMFPRDIHDVLLSIYMVLRRAEYYLPIPVLLILVSQVIALKRNHLRLDINLVIKPMLVFAGTALAVVMLFYIVMMQQFIHHDYYLLDTFSPLTFAFLLIFFSIKEIRFSNKQIAIFVVLMLGLGVSKLWRTIESSKEIRGYQTSVNFEGAAEMLDALKIDRLDKILVIDAYAPNLPFIHLERQGFLVLTTSKENIERALTWPFDYIITQNSFFESDVLANFPELVLYVKPVKDNGLITVWELSPIGKDKYPPKYRPESVKW